MCQCPSGKINAGCHMTSSPAGRKEGSAERAGPSAPIKHGTLEYFQQSQPTLPWSSYLWRTTSLPTSAFSWRVVRLNLPWFTMVVRVTEQTVVQGLVEASSPSTYLQHYDTFAVLNVIIIFYSFFIILFLAVCYSEVDGSFLISTGVKMLYLQWCHRTSETPAGENKTLTLAPPTKVSKENEHKIQKRRKETDGTDKWMPLHVSPGFLPIFCDYYQYFSFLTKWKNLIILLE